MTIRIHILTLLSILPFLANAQDESFSMKTISNGQSPLPLEMNVLNYGARIQSLKVGGIDVVLGFDSLTN